MQLKIDYSAFADVVYHREPSWAANIAAVDRVSGVLHINPAKWEKLSANARAFILAHEEGHLRGGINGAATDDELKADLYAFQKLAHTTGTSLRDMVIASSSFLASVPEQQKRKLIIYAYALAEDWVNHGNELAYKKYYEVKSLLADGYNVHDLKDLPKTRKSGFLVTSLIGLGLTAAGMVSGGINASKAKKEQKEAIAKAEGENIIATGDATVKAYEAADQRNDAAVMAAAAQAQQKKITTAVMVFCCLLLAMGLVYYRKYYKK